MYKFIFLFIFSFSLFAIENSGYRKLAQKEQELIKKNKIKTARIFLADSIFNKDMSTIFEIINYNKYGRILTDTLFNMVENEDNIPYYKYYYTEIGDIHKYEMYGFDLYPITHEYVYDENDGKPSGSSVDGAEPRRFTYFFDKKGYLIYQEGYTFYPSGDLEEDAQRPWAKIERQDFFYDKNYNQIKVEFKRNNPNEKGEDNWEPSYFIKRTFNKKNILIKEEYLNSENSPYLIKTIIYNKNGTIKSQFLHSQFDETKFLHYKYDFYVE